MASASSHPPALWELRRQSCLLPALLGLGCRGGAECDQSTGTGVGWAGLLLGDVRTPSLASPSSPPAPPSCRKLFVSLAVLLCLATTSLVTFVFFL